jgi:hypothetical protein
MQFLARDLSLRLADRRRDLVERRAQERFFRFPKIAPRSDPGCTLFQAFQIASKDRLPWVERSGPH